jgi:hypothetical protein
MAKEDNLKVGQKWTPAFEVKKHKTVPCRKDIKDSNIRLHGFEMSDERLLINHDMLNALEKLRETMR